MIKARATADGGEVAALLGLSTANIAYLMEGRPIECNLAEIGLSGKIVIFWGNTEDEMLAQLRAGGLIGPDTTVKEFGPREAGGDA